MTASRSEQLPPHMIGDGSSVRLGSKFCAALALLALKARSDRAEIAPISVAKRAGRTRTCRLESVIASLRGVGWARSVLQLCVEQELRAVEERREGLLDV